MRKCALILTLPVAALLLAPISASALDLPGWVPFVGKKDKTPAALAPSAGQETEAAEELKRGEAAESSGDTKGAIVIYRGIVKANTLTTSAPKAQFHIGQILERQGDLKDAYNAYSDYVSKYPRGGEFDAVIQAQFNIAKVFLDGRKKK